MTEPADGGIFAIYGMMIGGRRSGPLMRFISREEASSYIQAARLKRKTPLHTFKLNSGLRPYKECCIDYLILDLPPIVRHI